MTVEHDLIKRYFAPLCSAFDEAPAFGLLDDTALIKTGDAGDLLMTSDALVAGVHFFAADRASSLAIKALGVNVSDIVAKGGRPTKYLLTLALPSDVDESWLAEFSASLAQAQKRFGCQLVGGDTVSTSGPMMISISLTGEVEAGKMVRRSGAKPGDKVYVSGTIGDAALGLLLRLESMSIKKTRLSKAQSEHLLDRYLHPQPRFELAPILARYASACLDVSDGLAGDFEKLCVASKTGGRIEVSHVPLSKAASGALAQSPSLLQTILTGGDDYEVLMTVPAQKQAAFEREASPVTLIGEMTEQEGNVRFLDEEGREIDLSNSAYDHFGKS